MRRLLATAGLLAMLAGQSAAQQVSIFPGHSLIGVQVFTSGASTYTPDPGTNSVIVEVQAPGGGSGGCALTGATASCIGGSAAGGSYAKVLYTSGFAGITMTVGAVGTAGTAVPGAGGTGTTTTAGALVSCPGGTGGLVGPSANASAWSALVGGVTAPASCTISGGTTLETVQGQWSGYGFVSSNAMGFQYFGPSGGSRMGLGVPMQGTASATITGQAGLGYGWGAGGSVNSASQSATTGLAGGPGRIIVWEFN